MATDSCQPDSSPRNELAEPQGAKAEALEWLQVRQRQERIFLSELHLYSHVLTADMMRKYYWLE